MSYQWIKTVAAATIFTVAGLGASAQGWTPPGPVTIKIGFGAGGGADSMSRLLAQELGTRLGWEVIPENVAGRGGMAVLMELLGEPADGLTIGVSVTDSFTYQLLTAEGIDFTADDFTFLSTLTGSQMGIVARSDRGWTTFWDVIEAARAGENISVGVMNDKLADATYALGAANGVEFTSVLVQGGRAGLNGVIAQDVDVAWVAGLQAPGVAAGDLVNLLAAEDTPLSASPDAPLVSEFNVPFSSFGASFLVFGPPDMPEEIVSAYTSAIAEILSDPDSQLVAMLNNTFSGPQVVQGDDLRALVARRAVEAAALLAAIGE